MAAESVLWKRIRSQGVQTLSVMGMAKNTGKTVTLNHLLACAAADQLAVGVTSIGRDGEARDQVFSFPKPPVLVWPGMLVATARDALARASVRTQPVCDTGVRSPMGNVFIVRVQEHGAMEVAGASRSTELVSLIAQLQYHGASMVLLDGALGRSHHASPALTEGVVLATGAALGSTLDEVIRKTRDRLTMLALPSADEALRVRCAPVFADGGVAVWDGAGKCLLRANISTINSAATLMEHAQRDIKIIALRGAIGQALWRTLMTLAQRNPGLIVVVHDGTRLFVEAADLAALARRGAQMLAYRGMRILGVTVNPCAPTGTSIDPHLLLRESRAALRPYPVSDVVLAQEQFANP